MTTLAFRSILPLASVAALLVTSALPAQSLRGSRASINRMYRQALAEDFSFFETPARVRRAYEAGYLVRLEPDSLVQLHQVGYPYVRSQVRTFVHRLSAQYYDACGETLVVTSAIRPATRQPYNSTERSVHPTGMAIDLRKPRNTKCLRWLRNTLLSLERSGVLEATEEWSPPHFHVAVYPTKYGNYVAALTKKHRATTDVAVARYKVRPGDTLWGIARSHDTTVEALSDANDLHGATIRPGQELRIPTTEKR